MKKEIKNFDKIILITLIVLTTVSLIINALYFTFAVYDCLYNIKNINSVLVSKPFGVVMWIDNILIYFFALLYIIDSIKSKKCVLVKLAFSIFSVVTTIVFYSSVINLIARMFKIF